MKICVRTILSMALLVSTVPLAAQTNPASFTGTVTSKDGAVLPDAEVVATNVATQVTYPAKSNSDGLFTIPALPIGTYKVRATIQGYQPFETNEINLESGQIARLNISMQVGFEQNVEVTGVAPVLQTQDAVVGEVIS